jgi:lambda family phage portal protein
MASFLDNARAVADKAIKDVRSAITATIRGTQRVAGAIAQRFRRGDIQARYEGAVAQPYRSRLNAQLRDARYDQPPSTREILQKKARYFERNSALVNRLVDLFETYVVGQGIQFFPNSSDAAWNTAATNYWAAWKPFADLLSRQHFDVLQGLVARSFVIDGEIFILLTRGTGGRPRLQLIEAHRCKTPPDRVAEEGKTIIDGIAINEIGRPIGYWFMEDDFSGNTDLPMGFSSSGAATPSPVTFRFVEAINVVHIFEPSRAGQYRGLPLLYPVMNDLHDLDDLQMLEMKAARDAAEVSNVITNAAGQLEIGDLQASGGAMPASADPAQKACYYENTIGGRTLVLQTGDTIQQFKTERPSDATRNCWIVLEQKVCAGFGIARQLVYPESIQGTVERSVLDMQASWFGIRSSCLAYQFRRVWEYVISFGTLNELALSDPPADWRNVNTKAPRAINVDIGRQSSAMLAELNAGVRTRQQIWAEVGRDWEIETTQWFVEQASMLAKAKQFGVPPPAVAAPPPPPEMMPSETDEMPAPTR